MVKAKVLDRGDIIQINFDPQAGREINKFRHALVISPKIYNEKTALILCCPITSTVRGGPWEVLLPKRLKTQGVILVNQIKSMDARACLAHWTEKAPADIVEEVLEKLLTLVS